MAMNSFTRMLCLGASITGLLGTPVQAQEATNAAAAAVAKNLLLDADLLPPIPPQTAAWVFSTWNLHDNSAGAVKVDGKIITDADGHHCLAITASGPLHNNQMWWQNQNMACTGGTTYELTASVKGTQQGSGAARPTVGVYFLDASGKWLGFQEIAGNQASSLPADWQQVQGTVIAPSDAAKMGVRLGVIFTDCQAEAFYKDPVLIPKSN